MSEVGQGGLRRYILSSELHKKLDMQPHEDKLTQGVPDLSFVNGWLELKYRAKWPRFSDTVVTIPHFTPQQRQWARRRATAGQPCWLLMQVAEEYLLFGDGYWRWLGETTRTDMYIKSRGLIWNGAINFVELRNHLEAGWVSGYPRASTATYPAPDNFLGRRVGWAIKAADKK